MSEQYLISLENICKKYRNKEIINNFNLNIKPGERIGIIDANGSGKSTISEIISGVRKITSGKIIKKSGLVIGCQFQELKYPPGVTVMDMICYYLQTFKIDLTIKKLNHLLLTYQLTDLTKKMINELSGGQQQRLNILLSLIHNPQLIILDEISTGLDIEVKEEIFKFLQKYVIEKNIALILVSHNMNEIERFCERIIYIHDGKIIDDSSIKNIIEEHQTIDNYIIKMLNKHKNKLKNKKMTLVTKQKKV